MEHFLTCSFALFSPKGDDSIYVLSTNPSLLVSLYGALGSDEFIFMPSSIDPVISKNLRGHRGIIEHEVVSDDPAYKQLKVRGVQVDVLDNDGNFSYVSVVDQGGFHLMDEDGVGNFSFYIYPTTPPEEDVFINVVAPAAVDENRYVLVNGKDATILQFTAAVMEPQEVRVTYNPDVIKLDITEKNLLIKIDVDLNEGSTEDQRFINTEQSLLPVDIKLIPGMDNVDGAKAVTIFEDLSGTSVAEGSYGFNATYDVFLRPCSEELLQDIRVVLEESVSGQIVLTPSELNGTNFNNSQCKATVEVSAVDDGFAEGDHYANIRHVVTNSSSNGPIYLTDGSPLFAANVLIQIYDDDIGGVVVRETNGISALAELNKTDNYYYTRYVKVSAEDFIEMREIEVYALVNRNETQLNLTSIGATATLSSSDPPTNFIDLGSIYFISKVIIVNSLSHANVTLLDEDEHVLQEQSLEEISGVTLKTLNWETIQVRDQDLYEDEYSIRLSRAPANGTTVKINISSIAVATDYESQFTPDYRDYSNRRQVYVNGTQTTTLIFTSGNWSEEVILRITAIDDDIEEGANLLNFASQPSNLVSIYYLPFTN